MTDNMITRDAKRKIVKFNWLGLHYNLVAQEIYRNRRHCVDPFSQSFLRYIIAGLISFDMGRNMGTVKEAYKFEGNGFGLQLE